MRKSSAKLASREAQIAARYRTTRYLSALPAHASDRRTGQADAKEIGHQLRQPVLWQKLIVKQIDGKGGDARAILHRRVDAFGERRPRFLAAAFAAADMSAMFGDGKRLRFGQIEHLPGGVPLAHVLRQRFSTSRANGWDMLDHDIRARRLTQRLALVASLSAGLLAGHLAKARNPSGLLRPV